MKLVDMTVRDYTNLLASDASAPGGGSTAALLGAQGAGLTAMVCALTLGRKKYLAHEALCVDVRAQAEALKDSFLDVLDRDTEAFGGVSAALMMPKDSDEEKAARRLAMQEALKACTLTPMEMIRCAAQTLALTESILGKSNASAVSDLGVAVLSLKAAIQGAWLNVLINLGGIEDVAFRETHRASGQALLDETLPLADRLYHQIAGSL